MQTDSRIPWLKKQMPPRKTAGLFTFNEVLVFLATLVYRKKVDQKLALALNVVRHPKSWVTAGGDEKWWFHQWTWWFNDNLAKENDDSTIFRLQQFL